ncbi:SRPBCC family protein [Bacillus sp. B15-48]|uniref:SRPBCC family protein n=1 Tax=Bacillus sp. B15-48 TaxID=1548601 RepID=UPI00193EE718|nr:SRPBCC family protein [Bacillus sp. B15-48]
MASGKHTMDLQVSIHKMWTYISDINRWAPTIPGYVSHEIVNEKQSKWAIKGDLGLMKKTANLQVDIKQWEEPKKVSFDFKSLSGDFVGNGSYEAVALGDNHTHITGYLVIEPEARGPMAAMQKTILKKFVPNITKEITIAVAEQIVEIEKGSNSRV